MAVEKEWAELLEMLGTCTVEIVFDDGNAAVITVTPTPASVGTQTADCVDINTASPEDLQRIIHIGEARAEEIVQKRPFTSVQGLTVISGMGPARMADIEEQGLACVR